MGILKSIFGNDNHVSKILDGVYNGVDKLKFTDEERVDSHFTFLKLYEPYKLTQRLLALGFVLPYIFCWVITFLVSFFTEVDTQIEMLHGEVAKIVYIVAGFYFGGGAIEGIVGKLIRPKNKKED